MSLRLGSDLNKVGTKCASWSELSAYPTIKTRGMPLKRPTTLVSPFWPLEPPKSATPTFGSSVAIQLLAFSIPIRSTKYPYPYFVLSLATPSCVYVCVMRAR